ncbi:hypothetical protein EMIHUDRAFT_432118 [Emiliania huxleyi CCMP1516]|uniref:Uncharacterized protein n=2 Tax=Emiliania huxleyi TaxID=2903 RepID=A0A0D3JHK4_EMIH1|nr:hypothetical protein EMIHUDRAFT_432118 [Emiliania huxleyi CCMP1516]EOD22989.1 hypothetical protein EMIHUDRAFT_432118 [Emiliania huxleyi CCMP1516]|eukprot:XP_005775418.1 hypothetical protein EMIHUDRAFT_432118 [Emiliania huxleyi CCMP1516]
MVDMLRADLELATSKRDEPSPPRRRLRRCGLPRLAQCCGALALVLALVAGLFVGWRLNPDHGVVPTLLCPNVMEGHKLCHDLLGLPGPFLPHGSFIQQQCEKMCVDADTNAGKVCSVIKQKPGLIPCTSVIDGPRTAEALAKQLKMEYKIKPGQTCSEALKSTFTDVVAEDLDGAARLFFEYLHKTRLDALLLKFLEDPENLGQLTLLKAPYLNNPFGTGMTSFKAELVRTLATIPAVSEVIYNNKRSASVLVAELLEIVDPALGAQGDPQAPVPASDSVVHGGAFKLTPTPDIWAEYVEKNYFAGQGISLRRNDPEYPLHDRLANYFQNSWMSMLLFNINGEDGVYRFSCDYGRLSALGEAAPPLMLHLVTPDPTNETTMGKTLLRGGSAKGELVFEMVDGKLQPSDRQSKLDASQLAALLQCAHNGAQIYHVGLHVASEAMAYASQDLALGREDLSEDPVFRMLNPGGDATSDINVVANGLLVNVPGFGSRPLNAFDMNALKRHALVPLLADPCNASRYNPRYDRHVSNGTLGQQSLFNPTGRRALGVLCADVHDSAMALKLPERALGQYTRRLTSPAPEGLNVTPEQLKMEPFAIEPYEPPISAMIIGIEHTMTFSINFLWAELERQPPAEALPYANSTNPRAFGAAFFLDVASSAIITAFSDETRAECAGIRYEGDEPQQTSVTNEQLTVAAFPRSAELGYDIKLRKMARGLKALWTETTVFMAKNYAEYPVMNASFVYEVERCVGSSAWI